MNSSLPPVSGSTRTTLNPTGGCTLPTKGGLLPKLRMNASPTWPNSALVREAHPASDEGAAGVAAGAGRRRGPERLVRPGDLRAGTLAGREVGAGERHVLARHVVELGVLAEPADRRVVVAHDRRVRHGALAEVDVAVADERTIGAVIAE